MSAPQPTLIGYFPKRTARRGESRSIGASAVVEDVCNVVCASPGPDDWFNLWLRNDLWVYDTEARAWAVGTQSENLRRLCAQLRKNWAMELITMHFASVCMVSRGTLHDTRVLPALLAERDGLQVGLLVYAVDGTDCEVVALVVTRAREGIRWWA